MKVRYISEGIFMNPTQARAARAKAQELSNADKVSGTANKVIADKVKELLTGFTSLDMSVFEK